MALGTYSGLQASVADYLARSDLSSQITDFIALAEAKFQRRFKSVTSLSVSNTTNWLLTAHPDAYLYGSLLEAAPYLMDDARLAMWATALERVLAEIRHPDSSANLTSYAGIKLTIADWLARPDLDTVIPNFVKLAELRLSRDLRLRPLLQVVTTSTVAGTATVSLPSDYNAMRD